MSQDFDVIVAGAGIHGVGVAQAAAAAGHSVLVLEQQAIAAGSSSRSSKLVHGGLRYLESGQFRLVRESLHERALMLRLAPELVRLQNFYIPIYEHSRRRPWQLRIGLSIYAALAGLDAAARFGTVPRSAWGQLDGLDTHELEQVFWYHDAQTDDALLTAAVVRSAQSLDAQLAMPARFLGATLTDSGAQVRFEQEGREQECSARVLINAAGPFVDDHNRVSGEKTAHRHVFSKGIHLIVPQVTPQHRILTFFADDGRLFFVIPMGVRTCVGTTDTRVDSPYTEVTEEDRQFVLDNINKRLNLKKPLTKADIIAERCGVRPLVVKSSASGNEQDWLQMSRKHEIDVNPNNAHLSIFGGKLTDCVNVGNEVSGIVAAMGVELQYPDYKWYGEPHRSVREEYLHQARLMDLDSYTSPESIETLSSRLWRRYDQQALELLADIREDPRQAEVLIKGTDYIRCEIRLAKQQEMITKLEDFLRRRSKIALVVHKENIRNAPGLMEACEILFGDQAQEKYDEYFASVV